MKIGDVEKHEPERFLGRGIAGFENPGEIIEYRTSWDWTRARFKKPAI